MSTVASNTHTDATTGITPENILESPRRRHPKSRIGVAIVCFVTALGLALGVAGAGPAAASGTAGGTTFFGDNPACSPHGYLEVTVVPSRRIDYTQEFMVYIQSGNNGPWIQGPWHPIVNGMGATSNDFQFTGHGYYNVYIYYAQKTTAGWVYGGEYIHSFYQHSGTTSYLSRTCYI